MRVYAVKMCGTEVWYREKDFDLMERSVSEYVCLAGVEVEVEYLHVQVNPLYHCGALPKWVSSLSRLDIYYIDPADGCLCRKTCNIF